MPWEDVDTLRFRAPALQSGSIEKGPSPFEKDRIAGTEAVSETDPGQIGNERQRNSLIKRHEDSLGREPGCAERGVGGGRYATGAPAATRAAVALDLAVLILGRGSSVGNAAIARRKSAGGQFAKIGGAGAWIQPSAPGTYLAQP